MNKSDSIVRDNKEVAEILYDYFTNIVETTTDVRPCELPSSKLGTINDSDVIEILSMHENHPSNIYVKSHSRKVKSMNFILIRQRIMISFKS